VQDGPFTHQTLERQRMRIQTRVSLVVFWMLVVIAVILWDTPAGWYIFVGALGWSASGLARALIDAHYIVKGS
jgi:hypothetical protein